MTVPVPSQLVFAYDGDGVIANFSYPVQFDEPEGIAVLLKDADGSYRTLAYNVEYTVSGAGNLNGGTVSAVSAPLYGEKIYLTRDTVAKQIVDLADTAKNSAEAVERQLDRLTRSIQDIKEQVRSAFKAAPGQEGGVIDELVANIDALAAVSQHLPNIDAVAGDLANIDTVAQIGPDILEIGAESVEAYNQFVAAVANGRAWVLDEVGDGVTVTFTLSTTVESASALDVFVGGAEQIENFTVVGNQITFSEAPYDGLEVQARLAAATVTMGAGNAGLSILRKNTSSEVRDVLGLGSAALATAGDAAGNLKALNADGGFSFSTTVEPSIDFENAPFGGLWNGARASHVFATVQNSANSNPRTAVAITRIARGADTNGPAYTNLSAVLNIQKADYLTSMVPGEIDGFYVLGAQGRKGDFGGGLIDLSKVFGTADDAGGMTAFEAMTRRIDTSGASTHSLNTIFNFNEGVGGFLSTGTVTPAAGFYSEPRLGNSFAALAAAERSDLSGAPKFEYIVAFGLNRSTQAFHVTASAHADGFGLIRSGSGSPAAPAFSFFDDRDTGIWRVAADEIGFATNGVERARLTSTKFDLAVPLQRGGVQVVDARRTGWAAPTGTATRATFATGTVTVEQLAQRLKALIEDLTAHGLIGS